MDYQVLRNELLNDPASIGYAGMTDVQAAAALNNANQTRARAIIPAYEIYEAIVPAEWASLTAAEKQRVQTMLSMGNVNAAGTNTRASFLAAFGAGTTTRANLAALQNETVSRAAILGLGPVQTIDVTRARAGVW